jgi:hypothetical protein
MRTQGKLILGVTAAALLAAGVFLTINRGGQADLGGGKVFADLEAALGNIEEIRLSKGDGSRTTLRKQGSGWTVVERQFPADAQKVRELALALAGLRLVERKTADPANYARLGVETPDSPTATSTLVEVVAGKQTWSLIVGKGADARAVYVRKPAEAASFLAAPLVAADPDQKRWLDRLVLDLAAANVQEISAKTGKGPAYLLTRAERNAAFTLSPVPRGRKPATGFALGGQAEALTALHFEDLRAAAAPAAAADTVTYKTFDGQVITIDGRREGDKAFIIASASRDPAQAAKFAPPPAAPAAPAAATPGAAVPAPAPAPTDQSVERIAARAQGVEFEVPVYKYDAIFKPYEELLEPKSP